MPSAERVFLTYAQKFLTPHRPAITQGIEQAQLDNEILGRAIEGTDRSITSLNTVIARPREVIDSQMKYLPHAVNVRKQLHYGSEDEYITLPTLSQLAGDNSHITMLYSKATFQKVHLLMQQGESGEDGWEFHQHIADVGMLADALALEIYCQYIGYPFPELWGGETELLLALEEMLAVHHQESRVFHSVKEWITTDEGFSPELVNTLAGKVPRFHNGKVLRQTPNFRVVDGYKPLYEGTPKAARWIIEPRNRVAEQMLAQAAEVHHIDQNLTRQPVPPYHHRLTLRADRLPVNWRVLMGGFVDVPQEGEHSIPSPDRMEDCLMLHPEKYTTGHITA